MASKTFIQIPSNVDNPVTLRRFLAELILRLDIAFGNRARSPFASADNVEDVATTLGTVHATLDTVHATLDTVHNTLGTVTGKVSTLQTQLDTVTTTLDTVTTTLDTVTTTLEDVNGKVMPLLDIYSKGFNQQAQNSLNFPAAPTIDSSYNSMQVQQLANNVTVLANKIDSLLVVLRNAKIISV
ncbi:MAG: hypothetical protein JHC33_09170 [Ignisphaera sp.]|nr:hypothetical protein [Ignisphaera sp.]